MSDDTPLRIDPSLVAFDDHARDALDGIIGAGLDGSLGAALESPPPPPPPPTPPSSPSPEPVAASAPDLGPVTVPSGVGDIVSANHDGHGGPVDDDVDDDDLDDDVDDDVTGRLIRPYAMTGGRTGSDGPEIPLEAQVLASSQAAERRGTYRWEAAQLIDLVETPLALVEIAARLEVPVGVARVLVGDLVEDGSLIIHLPPPTSSFTSLLEQVLDGVRDL